MHTEEAKAFFASMAQKYGKYPHVIYELYNEPVEDNWEDLKVMHSKNTTNKKDIARPIISRPGKQKQLHRQG